MKFECPICKKPLKRVYSSREPKIKTIKVKNGYAANFGISYISGINAPHVVSTVTTGRFTYFLDYDSWTCPSARMETVPGVNYLLKNNHCRLDFDGGKVRQLTICVLPYQFCLDYENNTTEISLLEPYDPPHKGVIPISVAKINSILDLPWSHKAQVIDKAKLYTLFS